MMEHEQINDKCVALSARCSKMTGRVLAQMMRAFLKKAREPTIKHGKQSIKSLTKQGALTIIKQNGGAYIDSREVAEAIGKAHKNLLRDIAGDIGYMRNSTELNFEPSDFFLESTYVDSTGQTLPRYLISKMGCEMVANKLFVPCVNGAQLRSKSTSS